MSLCSVETSGQSVVPSKYTSSLSQSSPLSCQPAAATSAAPMHFLFREGGWEDQHRSDLTPLHIPPQCTPSCWLTGDSYGAGLSVELGTFFSFFWWITYAPENEIWVDTKLFVNLTQIFWPKSFFGSEMPVTKGRQEEVVVVQLAQSLGSSPRFSCMSCRTVSCATFMESCPIFSPLSQLSALVALARGLNNWCMTLSTNPRISGIYLPIISLGS